MKISATPIDGVLQVSLSPRRDARGSFTRLFCDAELAGVLSGRHIVQVNHSLTLQTGAVRGMHYQLPPHSEIKFVKCLKGRVWDVAVDLRRGSPTFLRWTATELSADNGIVAVIPEGCAHGFQALEPDCELLYLHTAAYDPALERGVSCTDPALGVNWPLPIADLSPRDAGHPPLEAGYSGIAA